ncbi:MAG: 4Fe-4S binding protein [Anaerolineales bacterium]|nr:4Fe-4S binding protein [Anaerolineales bacterium]
MLPDICRSLFRRPATGDYPFVAAVTPERLRGRLEWDPAACTGCGLCAMDCPASALAVAVLDRKARRFVLQYHLDRCIFCGQCVVSCRQGCLRMTGTPWELAALTRETFVTYFGDPTDVEQVLAVKPEEDPGTPG